MKKFVAVIFVLALLSCGGKLIEKPDNLIPKDQMVGILNDLAIMNAANNANASKLEENNIDPTNFVFEKYGIDSLQFVSSDTYYASMPKEYEEIYTEVEALLELEKERITEEKRIQDSLLLQSKTKKSPVKNREPKKATDTLP
ncbi:DUF4296 domain-containing protein [Maribacter polysaccharolyticus]|uniref:DUF4296 domain-containing protein n=1 Tax=Maribacter polysaccharolyticus TaxID=3020831 RepID=UPI00237F8151|nr:DUF4296 domain-containing protein [Maribacter polysaccharolyticus]MDE3742990.1 DUF4296 domain-containing protein [Maribacter polysaccharolyticus]